MGNPNPIIASAPQLPPALPNFEHIRRTWDVDLGLPVAKLLPGDYYVTRYNEAIFTVLGSCVSACVRERKLGIGGMNHFMLPLDQSGGTSAWAENLVSSATRYGNVAMERLINDIMRLGGSALISSSRSSAAARCSTWRSTWAPAMRSSSGII